MFLHSEKKDVEKSWFLIYNRFGKGWVADVSHTATSSAHVEAEEALHQHIRNKVTLKPVSKQILIFHLRWLLHKCYQKNLNPAFYRMPGPGYI